MSPRSRHICAIHLLIVAVFCGRWPSAQAQSLQRLDLDLLRAVESNNRWAAVDIPVEFISLVTPFVETGVTFERYLTGRRTNNRRALEAGVLAGVSIVATQVVAVTTKFLLGRDRPPRDEESYRPRLWNSRSTPSFPSGHSATTFAFAGSLGRVYPKWRYWLFGYAAVSGLAQIYVGNHYPSDVLAGAILGYGVSTLVWHTRPRVVSFLNKVGLVSVKSTGGWRLAVSISL